MRYLARLVTPANGVVLDMFTGAGSTGKAAMLEGFRFLGFELCASYARIARARIEHVIREQQRASHRIGQSDQGGGLNRAP
jgi:site-specific DNA-methyltransferase (adenine-specific)